VELCSVQLTPEYSFHMVKIDEKAYMVSAEVSALLWKEDIIRTKVSDFVSTSECESLHNDGCDISL